MLIIEKKSSFTSSSHDTSSIFLRFASLEQPEIRVVACDTKATRIIEVNGKRYRARIVYDDGVEHLTWGASDEVEDGG